MSLLKVKIISLVSLDAINPIDFTLYGAMGFEYGLSETFFVRGGTHFGHDTADASLGLGLIYRLKALV